MEWRRDPQTRSGFLAMRGMTMTIRKISAARFLTGASVLALTLCAAPALAGTYHATDDASLIAAINSANADPDASGTVILDNDIALGGSVLPTNSKPITIDTNGHTYTRAWINN